MRTQTFLALAGAAAAVLTGCGGNDNKSSSSSSGTASTSAATSTSPSAGSQALSVGETEFKLNPGTLQVSKPGTVKITVANNGTTVHALEVEGPGGEAKTGDIQPGARKTLTVRLNKAGSFEMYCPVDGHRKLGMAGTVTVAAGGAGGVERQGKPGQGGGSDPGADDSSGGADKSGGKGTGSGY
jgi:uncharacterized cupredoxin-like copper-binding protein